MNVDVEIYMNNIVKFFKSNPKDLLNLVPKEKEEEFYDKIREVAIENSDNGEDAPLTQKQMIDICVILNGKTPKEDKVIEEKLESYIMGTKFGPIFLN
jgi:hypothetical protein